ncbi:ABC transporter ATP-binding protein [Fibrobacter sp. UWEL]|uniref:ABC transporter ATP-binding protein n=1 Tax=Fibrobacter sp. UWEL TaxID=1896209 RepID=UPI00091EC79C|nr:ABC transporter ATP-binding protein [Fibrobacter sp. UWEL]SHL48648.1 lipopolysaccharide transport system ATP-binding protein [Fibrobacter sp. UWEL]
MATAIEFENISKQYRLGLVSTGTLSHDLNRFWQTKILRREDPYLKVGETNDRASKGDSDYVWALKDINFKIEQGDVVGIIGRNGAGKSTLLKLLSRVTAPTTGIIRAKGRIASLLEVGTGFHPEMTGRENIYMNGAIMGMTRSEITRKLDEIVDFSGCERYLDTPVKRYSSGMTVRLGFAIAAHLEPEILVVDEVLAVGDAEFQKKAIGKMQDVSKGEGRTVLFVSHNMGAVKNLCKTGILMDQGQIAYCGNIEDTIEKYLNSGEAANVSNRFANKPAPVSYIKKLRFVDKDNREVDKILSGEPLDIVVDFCCPGKSNADINIGIYKQSGEQISRLSTEYTPVELPPGNEHQISFSIKRLCLNEGNYFFNISLWINKQTADWLQYPITLNVVNGDFYKNGKNPSSKDGLILTEYTCKSLQETFHQ